MTAIANQNRAMHRAVLDLTVAYLQQSGLAVEARPYNERISDAIAEPVDGDIRGVQDAFVTVTSRQVLRLDKDMDRARVGADITGRDVAIVVQWRASRGIDQAYVVTDLRSLVSLLGGTAPP